MTLEASFTKCQGLCSFQEHFPQKVGQCLKPASTPSHCIYVRIHSNSAFFAPSGQRLSSPGHKKSTIIGQITPTPDVMSRNSGSKIRSTFSRWQREKKVSRRCLHCYPAKLSVIQILFTASSSSLSSPSSPSLTAAHFELHGFVEYIFVYPVPGVFQEYACIIRQPLSKSHYSLISLVYLL